MQLWNHIIFLTVHVAKYNTSDQFKMQTGSKGLYKGCHIRVTITHYVSNIRLILSRPQLSFNIFFVSSSVTFEVNRSFLLRNASPGNFNICSKKSIVLLLYVTVKAFDFKDYKQKVFCKMETLRLIALH